MEKIEYKGGQNCYRLSNDLIDQRVPGDRRAGGMGPGRHRRAVSIEAQRQLEAAYVAHNIFNPDNKVAVDYHASGYDHPQSQSR